MRKMFPLCFAVLLGFLAGGGLRGAFADNAAAEHSKPSANATEESVQPLAGPIGKFQLISVHAGNANTVNRIDTQTGQVWEWILSASPGHPNGVWIALPQDAMTYAAFEANMKRK
jgi:hypothetical protein